MLAEARRLRLDHLRHVLADWDDPDVETLATLLDRFNVSLGDASFRAVGPARGWDWS